MPLSENSVNNDYNNEVPRWEYTVSEVGNKYEVHFRQRVDNQWFCALEYVADTHEEAQSYLFSAMVEQLIKTA